MLKRWNRSAGKPIYPSFLIEVMALDLFDPPFTDLPERDPPFLRGGARRHHAALARSRRPRAARLRSDDAGKATKARSDALRAAEVKAARAVQLERQGKNGEALALWREIMGKYFPTS